MTEQPVFLSRLGYFSFLIRGSFSDLFTRIRMNRSGVVLVMAMALLPGAHNDALSDEPHRYDWKDFDRMLEEEAVESAVYFLSEVRRGEFFG